MDPGSAQRRERVVTVLNALGEGTRMQIVERVLREDEVACSSLDDSLGLAKSTISYHAKILHAAGLIAVRREGRFFHYSPTPALRELKPILETLGQARFAEQADDRYEAQPD